MSALPVSRNASRDNNRLDVALPVEFRGPKGIIEATAVNISEGGMFVKTPAPLPDGSKAFFRIRVRRRALQVHLEGLVIWSEKKRRRGRNARPKGMGVRFLPSRAQNEKTLENIFSVLHTIKSTN